MSQPGISPDDRAMLEELGLLTIHQPVAKTARHTAVGRKSDTIQRPEDLHPWVKDARQVYMEAYNRRQADKTAPIFTVYDAIHQVARARKVPLTPRIISAVSDYLKRACPGSH